jgi:polyisoprenyl-phosphate glycosyltransferase
LSADADPSGVENISPAGPQLLSVVVPVFNEEGNVGAFLDVLRPILHRTGLDYEILFALDPSPDRTAEVLLQHHAADPRIKVLEFSRRVGQPMATLAGLHSARGDAVVVIDVDLQDPPELILEMVAKWQEGWDVVMAQRRSRAGETWIKRLISYVGYQIINRIAETPIPPNTGDFRLMSRRVVDQVNQLKESHGFLRGLVSIVGFRQTCIPFDRQARHAGRGNYNRFFGSLRIGFNGLVCFSSTLLTLSSMAGFAIAGLSFLLGAVYGGMKLLGFPFPMGNPTIVLLMLFLGGIQLISVGILGSYVARIYEEVKRRPKFIIEHAVGFDAPAVQVLASQRNLAGSRAGHALDQKTKTFMP